MAAKDIIQDTEDAKMNMTPMIDMTFLLVVFFMLTIDLSSKEFFPVELPYATEGIEDKPDPTNEIKRFVINLTRDGKIHFKQNEFDLASDDPGIQDDNIVALRTALRQLHSEGGGNILREPDGASKVPVMIHADWGTKWKYVQWVMQACAHPDIKIYKLQFAVKKPPSKDGN